MKQQAASVRRKDEHSFVAQRLSIVNSNDAIHLRHEPTTADKLEKTKALALSLVQELNSLSVSTPNIDVRRGVSFYEEVRRFECELIRQALILTGGHQVRAAALLRLGVTTLNAMIKRYDISPHNLMTGKPSPPHIEDDDGEGHDLQPDSQPKSNP